MRVYGEASYSIAADLLDGDMIGPVTDGNAEITVIKDAGGIAVLVRVQADTYSKALTLIVGYSFAAAREVQQDGLDVPQPYSVRLIDSRALEAHYGFAAELASMDDDA